MGYWGYPIAIQSMPTDPVDTDRSTMETLREMIALAHSSSHSPYISAIANACLSTLPLKPSHRELVRAIYTWEKKNIKFREDEDTLVHSMGARDPYQELLISPDVLVTMPNPMGDCDDFSMLLASLLLCVHIPVWYVAIAVDPQDPMRFSHVYCKCLLQDEGQFLNLDCSHGNYIGWETPRDKFRRIECFVG